MHAVMSKNLDEDPLQVPTQLDEVVPLTPVQIFVKEEPVCVRTEEPVLVSLVPMLPKEELGEESLSGNFGDDSSSLVINLESSSSEELTDNNGSLAVEPIEGGTLFMECADRSSPYFINVEDAATGASPDAIRLDQEVTQSTFENEELYELIPVCGVLQAPEDVPVCGVIQMPEAVGVPLVSDFTTTTTATCTTKKPYCCGLCDLSFSCDDDLEVHTQSHAVESLLQQTRPLAKQGMTRTHRMQHTCNECGSTFDRLDHLMRHRLGHICGIVRKPLSETHLDSSGASDTRRTKTGVKPRPSTKRGPKRPVSKMRSKLRQKRSYIRRRRLS